jgi:hypothetical protein
MLLALTRMRLLATKEPGPRSSIDRGKAEIEVGSMGVVPSGQGTRGSKPQGS